jgi:hypothetical protein
VATQHRGKSRRFARETNWVAASLASLVPRNDGVGLSLATSLRLSRLKAHSQ